MQLFYNQTLFSYERAGAPLVFVASLAFRRLQLFKRDRWPGVYIELHRAHFQERQSGAVVGQSRSFEPLKSTNYRSPVGSILHSCIFFLNFVVCLITPSFHPMSRHLANHPSRRTLPTDAKARAFLSFSLLKFLLHTSTFTQTLHTKRFLRTQRPHNHGNHTSLPCLEGPLNNQQEP